MHAPIAQQAEVAVVAVAVGVAVACPVFWLLAADLGRPSLLLDNRSPAPATPATGTAISTAATTPQPPVDNRRTGHPDPLVLEMAKCQLGRHRFRGMRYEPVWCPSIGSRSSWTHPVTGQPLSMLGVCACQTASRSPTLRDDAKCESVRSAQERSVTVVTASDGLARCCTLYESGEPVDRFNVDRSARYAARRLILIYFCYCVTLHLQLQAQHI
jgi:hypothetical protein